MNLEGASKLIDSVAKLVSSIAWPSVTAVLMVKFWPDILKIFEASDDIILKGLGFEATLKSKASASANALAAARATRPGFVPSPDSAAEESSEAADVVTRSITPRFLHRAKRSVVLWVDERPDNNIFERKALEALGVRFILTKSTDEAHAIISNQKVDVIISDMDRPPDPKAGYTLLDLLRQKGIKIPYIIYAGSRSQEHVTESQAHGAMGCTNDPYELFQYVVEALRFPG